MDNTLLLILVLVGALVLVAIYLFSKRDQLPWRGFSEKQEGDDLRPPKQHIFGRTPRAAAPDQGDPEDLEQELAQLADMLSEELERGPKGAGVESVRSRAPEMGTKPAADKAAPRPVTGNKPVAGIKPMTGSHPVTGLTPVAGSKPAIGTKPAPSPRSVTDRKPAADLKPNSGPDRQARTQDIRATRTKGANDTQGASELVILNVMARGGQQFRGADILSAVRAAGLEFGDKHIFHRLRSELGSQRPVFSLANMLEPGSFDIERMETLSTTGLLLFMQLPAPPDGVAAYQEMLSVAQGIAQSLGGDVCDERRSLLTTQAITYTQDRIREFHHRLAMASKGREQD